MSYRSKNIRTVHKLLGAATVTNVGSMVPAGMKRYVTFVEIDKCPTLSRPSAVAVYLASATVSNQSAAGLRATGVRKLRTVIRATAQSGLKQGNTPITIPRAPSLDNPLFTIAASSWLVIGTSLTSAAAVIQYFEE
jgi:hypothetical protein